MISLLLLILLVYISSLASLDLSDFSSKQIYNILDYGAIPDSITLNTLAIFKTISIASLDATLESPSIVYVPSVSNNTVYLSGQIRLNSNVYLYIDQNATLLASANQQDWITLTPDQWIFILTDHCDNVGIFGGGTIDGNMLNYINGWNDTNNQFIVRTFTIDGCLGECRPRNVLFNMSTNIFVYDVLITHSPDWTFQVLGCDFVSVINVRQYGDYRWPNNDGFDIYSSRHVYVQNISINTGDDGVCIKADIEYGEVYNITVVNSTLRSRSSAIKFGSNINIDCHDLVFENITIWDSNCGLGIQARSYETFNSSIYNVLYKNITIETRQSPKKWWGDGEPIWISTIERVPGQNHVNVYNITYEHIHAISQNTAFLSGVSPGGFVKDIYMNNVTIVIDRLPSWNYSHADLDYRPTSVFQDLVPQATEGLHVQQVENLVLNNVSVYFNMKHYQPYWSNECFNFTSSVYPVIKKNLYCSFD